MKLKRPSPAMVVALVALVMSMTGGAIAAVNYAQNAGKVDGYDAVKAKSSNNKAAGNLVATYPGGKLKGKLPFRFLSGAASQSALADVAARARDGMDFTSVSDNAETTQKTLIDLDLGELRISCVDQNANTGVENGGTRVTVTNDSGGQTAIARRLGTAQLVFETLENGSSDSFVVGQENTFTVQLAGPGRTVLVEGAARQRSENTPDGACEVWATALVVE